VELRYDEHLYNEVPAITKDILHPGKNSKTYGTEPRYNEPRNKEILDIRNKIPEPKLQICPDRTNKCHHSSEVEWITDQQRCKQGG